MFFSDLQSSDLLFEAVDDTIEVHRNKYETLMRKKTILGYASAERIYKQIKFLENNKGQFVTKAQGLLTNPNFKPATFRKIILNDIHKDKSRTVYAPTRWVDRIIVTALRLLIEGSYKFHPSLHGGRPEHGVPTFIYSYLWAVQQGYCYSLKVDIKRAFSSTNQELVPATLRKQIKDKKLLALIKKFIAIDYKDDSGNSSTLKAGLPEGSPLSPTLFNVVMNSVMNRFHEKGFIAVVYIDDLIILGRTAKEALEAKHLFQSLIEERGLNLHPTKTQTIPVHNREFQDLLGLGLNYMRIEAGLDEVTGEEKTRHHALVLKGVRRQWRKDCLQLVEVWNKDKKGYDDDTLRLRAEALENIATVIELGADDPLRKELRTIVAKKIKSAPEWIEPNITGPVHSMVSPVSSNSDSSTISTIISNDDCITKGISTGVVRDKNPSTAHVGSRPPVHPLFPSDMNFPISSIISRRLDPEQSPEAMTCYDECFQVLCDKSLSAEKRHNKVIPIIDHYYYVANSTLMQEELEKLLPDGYQMGQRFSPELKLRKPYYKKIGGPLIRRLNLLFGSKAKIIIDAEIERSGEGFRICGEPNIRSGSNWDTERILVIFQRKDFPTRTLSFN